MRVPLVAGRHMPLTSWNVWVCSNGSDSVLVAGFDPEVAIADRPVPRPQRDGAGSESGRAVVVLQHGFAIDQHFDHRTREADFEPESSGRSPLRRELR